MDRRRRRPPGGVGGPALTTDGSWFTRRSGRQDRYDGGLSALAARATRLIVPGRRHVLGLTGPPASGKSTLADLLGEALAPGAVVVPMDGYHLAGAELHRLGRTEVKGAPETFDATGFVALLRRLRDPSDALVYAPRFHRDIEEPVAGAIPVPATVPLVIVEGNYLLLEDGPWAPVRGLLDEVWYLASPDALRLARLAARHVAFGRSREAATARAHGPDQRNADLIATTRGRADLVVRVG